MKELVVLNVTLFSTGCPRCKVLKKKLDDKGVKYTVNNDVDKMLEMGIVEVPVLAVGEKMMGFKESMEWVNELG